MLPPKFLLPPLTLRCLAKPGRGDLGKDISLSRSLDLRNDRLLPPPLTDRCLPMLPLPSLTPVGDENFLMLFREDPIFESGVLGESREVR